MANFMGMTLARDLHLGRVRGLDGPPRGAALDGARVYTSDQTHFSIARALDELGFPPETLVVLPADDDFHLRGAPVADAVRRDRAAGLTPFAIAAVAGSTNTGSVDAIGELADVAAAEDLWLHVDAAYGGGGPAVGARPRPRSGPRSRRFGHGRPAQVVLPGLRHRRAAGPRRPGARRGLRRPRARVLPRRRDADVGRGARRTRPRRPRRPAQLLQAELRGHPPLACAQAVDDLEAPRHDRVRPPDRGQRRPRRTPRGPLRCVRRLRGTARRPGAVRRLLPPPPAGPGRCRTLDAHQDRLQAALEASGDGWLTTTRLRGATWLRAGIVNYLATEADIDHLLDTLRRLADPA